MRAPVQGWQSAAGGRFAAAQGCIRDSRFSCAGNTAGQQDPAGDQGSQVQCGAPQARRSRIHQEAGDAVRPALPLIPPRLPGNPLLQLPAMHRRKVHSIRRCSHVRVTIRCVQLSMYAKDTRKSEE